MGPHGTESRSVTPAASELIMAARGKEEGEWPIRIALSAGKMGANRGRLTVY